MASRPAQRKPYSRPTAPRAQPDGKWLHDRAPTGPRAAAANRPVVPVQPAAPASINSKLLVKNLHYEITPKDLISVFGQIGTLVREPRLMYDRSGRSLGEAIISFETSMEATRAKKQFDGYLARGQPMSILYYTAAPPPRAPRASRRAASVPTTVSLINRIEKPPLAERLAGPVDDMNIQVPSAPRAFAGPVRNRGGRNANASNKAKANANANANPPAARTTKAPKKAKTAEELDQELDAFMGDAPELSAVADDSTVAASTAQDVDMALV